MEEEGKIDDICPPDKLKSARFAEGVGRNRIHPNNNKKNTQLIDKYIEKQKSSLRPSARNNILPPFVIRLELSIEITPGGEKEAAGDMAF